MREKAIKAEDLRYTVDVLCLSYRGNKEVLMKFVNYDYFSPKDI